jgi:hypothetical protein
MSTFSSQPRVPHPVSLRNGWKSKGRGQFCPSLRRSSLADTRYASLLAPRPGQNWLPSPPSQVVLTGPATTCIRNLRGRCCSLTGIVASPEKFGRADLPQPLSPMTLCAGPIEGAESSSTTCHARRCLLSLTNYFSTARTWSQDKANSFCQSALD